MRPLRRVILRVQGIDPDDLDREKERMDAAKRARDAEKEQAEKEAHRYYVNLRMRRG